MNKATLHAAFQPHSRKEEYMLQQFEMMFDRQARIFWWIAASMFVVGFLFGMVV